MLLTLSDLEKEFFLDQEDVQAFHFQFDSKLVEKDDIFIALKGEKADGHDFLKEAAGKGAFGAIVNKDYGGDSFGLKLYKVEDVVEIIQGLAKKVMENKRGKVISITGSVGKTTTKEFLYNILCDNFTVSRNPKSFNSQRGLALSILNMPKKQDIVLLEMGMSEKGEMEKLSNIVKPDIALFTPIGLVHAGNFEGIEEIVQEKAKMRCKKRTEITIAPFDLLKYEDIFPQNSTISYSIKDERADYFLCTEKNQIIIKGKNEAVFPKIFEETHFLENFLGSFAVAKEMGMKNEDIEKRLIFLTAAPLRFEKVFRDGVLYIQDCYNANYLSMIAALENLPKVKGKRIAVLGEMGELGKFSKMSHEMVGEVAAKKVDVLLCFGKETKYLLGKYNEGKNHLSEISFYFEDLKLLKEKLNSIIQKEDLVLIKGSRFLELERIFNS